MEPSDEGKNDNTESEPRKRPAWSNPYRRLCACLRVSLYMRVCVFLFLSLSGAPRDAMRRDKRNCNKHVEQAMAIGSRWVDDGTHLTAAAAMVQGGCGVVCWCVSLL